MPRVWTHGVWSIAPGRDEDFITAWRALVPVGVRLGSAEPALVRDRERPSEFRSFGAWPDLGVIKQFRDEIRPHLAEMDELIERFDTFTLDEVYPGG
jgi:hypothetical protein